MLVSKRQCSSNDCLEIVDIATHMEELNVSPTTSMTLQVNTKYDKLSTSLYLNFITRGIINYYQFHTEYIALWYSYKKYRQSYCIFQVSFLVIIQSRDRTH